MIKSILILIFVLSIFILIYGIKVVLMFRKEKEKLPEVKPASMVTGSNIKTSSFIYSKAQSKM
eukprot:jgi/Orpsp1_1/1175467/evm.model.c7180000054006.1